MSCEYGSITVLTGPMYSGKTKRLISRLEVHEVAKDPMLVVRHSLDNRYDPSKIVSHNKSSFEAENTATVDGIRDLLIKKGPIKVLAVDEIQFFEKDIVNLCLDLERNGVQVYTAGLDTDFLKRPFPIMSELLPVANYIEKAYAVCSICRLITARWTQKLINSKPASRFSPLIQIGSTIGEITYQARCSKHHEIPD